MFRTKICGITTPEDAEAAIDAGADAIGLNFYRSSPRFLKVAQAREIFDAVRGKVLAVGVFVDVQPDWIRKVTEDLGLDLVQLSGNDSATWVQELRGLIGTTPIMQAVRVGSQGLSKIQSHLAACRQMNCLPQLVLWDAYDAAQFGGTGRVADWEAAARCAADKDFPPLVLAGGLRPENVADAIRTVRPQGVDAASGVEIRPGVKDPERMRSFVLAAQAAFDNPRGSD